MNCDICESDEFNIIKCENNCSYNTCIKCMKFIGNDLCPQCRGIIYDKNYKLFSEINIMANCFKAKRILKTKLMKNSIRLKILKICIEDLTITDDENDLEFCRDDLIQLKKLIKDDIKLFEHFLYIRTSKNLFKIINSCS